MKTLDIRSIEVLTREILDSAPAWAIVYNKNAFVAHPDNIRGHSVRIDGVDCAMVAIECFGSEISVPFNASGCYPCKPYAPFEPIPWPVEDGEEEIEEWRGADAMVCQFGLMWCPMWNGSESNSLAIRVDARPGLHPAVRRRIERDGAETPVWVWEKDR